MNNRNIRKDHEQYILERFLKAAGFYASKLETSDPPDFRVTIDGREIGIEVTELYIQPQNGQESLKARDSITEKIVQSAHKIYEKMGGNPVHVTVTFAGGINMRDIHRDSLAKELAKLVYSLPFHENRHIPWNNDFKNETLDAVAFINTLLVPKREMAHWGAAGAGWAAPLSIEALQERISAKNETLKKYRKFHKEVWLLIGILGNRPSQFFNLDELPDTSSIKSDFDQTFLYRVLPEKILNLGASHSA